MATIGTINEEGLNVDLYIPRKCHATNTLISSFDHSAVQIAIADIDPNGVYNGNTKTFCIAGYLRGMGESDHAINRLAISNGIVRIKTGKRSKKSKEKKTTKAPTKVEKAPVKGGKATGARGVRPAGKPQGKRPAGKPQGERTGKPQGERTGKPQGERTGKPQGERTGKPQGERRAPRPAGKKPAAPKQE
jgi:small subunit ribosomal protein S21e